MRKVAIVTSLASLLQLAGVAICQPVASTPLEYQVKAAFIINFTKFIEWPPEALGNPDQPAVICIVGVDRFGSVIDQMVEGENINGRKVIVQRLSRPPAGSCLVLFISSSERDIQAMVGSTGRGTLTVGEGDQFIRDGGMISFAVENSRVRFDINQKAAERGGLRFSSRLLNVARSIRK